ncbi:MULTISPECIES: hypothetical protein [unclassified Streptomyces]|uniref:hypothetical protein n=1 Tax=unclassified Streptomyces TaxID=2593676 RepID=UPI002E18B8DC|nr:MULTISPECIES: hypothetical protein [unclassified Streptomyces]
MSYTVRAEEEEQAEPIDADRLDSPGLGQGAPPYEGDDSRPPGGWLAALRLVLVGLASGLIVVGLAVALME